MSRKFGVLSLVVVTDCVQGASLQAQNTRQPRRHSIRSYLWSWCTLVSVSNISGPVVHTQSALYLPGEMTSRKSESCRPHFERSLPSRRNHEQEGQNPVVRTLSALYLPDEVTSRKVRILSVVSVTAPWDITRRREHRQRR